MKVLKFFK